MRFLLSESTGWAAVALVAATVVIAYTRRADMRPHYWIGYAIAGVTVVHAWLSMAPGSHSVAYSVGVWVASGAMLLVFAQVVLGLQLREGQTLNGRRLRRAHFWVMAALVVAGLAHLALNGALVHRLTGLGG